MKDEDTLEQIQLMPKEEDKSKQIDAISDVEEKGKSSKYFTYKDVGQIERIAKVNNGYQTFNFILALTGLTVGATYINVGKEYCPWSPYLPAFLFTHGIVNLFFSCFLAARSCCVGSTRKYTKIFYNLFIAEAALLFSIGLIVWGFDLLYSSKEEVNYFKYEYIGNATYSRNKNYCEKVVYLVPLIITWTSVAGYIILIGLFYCCYAYCFIECYPQEDVL